MNGESGGKQKRKRAGTNLEDTEKILPTPDQIKKKRNEGKVKKKRGRNET